ncbi:hypothetical protein LIP_2152 [Limnochorda pilosa]|uniref:Uncharacterized protein n=1 Tax=Limnochorda pilosa TaxID=1555112 RepID=A0A0K2SLJ7_LIMPI|nr:hypothetical protein LIP_2152 [Limnochorda pilosa]
MNRQAEDRREKHEDQEYKQNVSDHVCLRFMAEDRTVEAALEQLSPEERASARKSRERISYWDALGPGARGVGGGGGKEI